MQHKKQIKVIYYKMLPLTLKPIYLLTYPLIKNILWDNKFIKLKFIYKIFLFIQH